MSNSITFKDNPEYKEVFYSKVHDKRFYMPANIADYHLSRQIAAQAQDIYAAAGVSKDVLEKFMTTILDIVNEEKNNKRIRTDIGAIANNILYRTKYPVDELCALRLGVIYTFVEGEQEEYSLPYARQKEVMAMGDPTDKNKPADNDLYTFFLNTGIKSQPAWEDLDEDSKTIQAIMTRQEILKTMLPNTPKD